MYWGHPLLGLNTQISARVYATVAKLQTHSQALKNGHVIALAHGSLQAENKSNIL